MMHLEVANRVGELKANSRVQERAPKPKWHHKGRNQPAVTASARQLRQLVTAPQRAVLVRQLPISYKAKPICRFAAEEERPRQVPSAGPSQPFPGAQPPPPSPAALHDAAESRQLEPGMGWATGSSRG